VGKTSVSYRFDSALYDVFRKVVREQGRSMTWYFERLMSDVVKQAGVKPVEKKPARVRRVVKKKRSSKRRQG